MIGGRRLNHEPAATLSTPSVRERLPPSAVGTRHPTRRYPPSVSTRGRYLVDERSPARVAGGIPPPHTEGTGLAHHTSTVLKWAFLYVIAAERAPGARLREHAMRLILRTGTGPHEPRGGWSAV